MILLCSNRRRALIPALLTVAAILAPRAHAEESPLDFFEKHVRPVLVESCYECHGEKKQKGGLRLDTKAACEKGGDTGPAVVPGNPDKSVLIQAVRYLDHDLQMPPEKNGGKLAPEKIAALEAWVKMGAPDPRTVAAASPGRDMSKANTHWAFKPVSKPAVPAVKNTARVQTPVDAFVLAKLEAKGLTLAPAADRRTLLRRVYLDLTGLPPSPLEMEKFLADKSPDAFAKVVDSLLASPHYGERWGRYWLDVARYADTKGYLGGGEERRFPFSFTYRDYVVKAFAEDKPYDQFLREQLAADKLVNTTHDQAALAAMGFLTLGRAGPAQDMTDDKIDVVTRGLMALTVACARCHDHKFDPIPTADYYSLAGVFQSSEEPEEKPLLTSATPEGPAYQDYLKKRAEIDAKIQAKRDSIVNEFLAKERKKLGDYLLAAHDAPAGADKAKLEVLSGERKLAGPILTRWIAHLKEPARLQHDPVLGAWLAYAALKPEDFAGAAKTVQLPAETAPSIKQALTEKPLGSLKEVAAIYNRLSGDNPEKKVDDSVRGLIVGPDAPSDLPRAEAEKVQGRTLREQTAAIKKEFTELNFKHPGAPLRAMAMVDKANPVEPRIAVRGNPGTPGAKVPRQFLEILSGPTRQPFKDGSGRLELANAIASKSNPLTARVFMNRVWGWHFGQPIVRTPGDFGVRTDAPIQADLLDWLSAQFMENGWSLRQIQREILLSSTYQQASEGSPESEAGDPGNELWHRFNRHRLDFEAMRDTILAASGKLDRTVGGQPVEIDKQPYSVRRTIYGFIDRLNLPGVFRTFDFANPDISSPQRFSTTVPQQALFMLNNPLVIEQSRALVHRSEVERCTNDEERINAIYTVLYQRPPDPEELSQARNFLESGKARVAKPPAEGGWQYGYGSYDEEAKRTKEFHAFAHVQKDRRSPEDKIPSSQFAFVSLTPGGGHPGRSQAVATVLRWTSPLDGEVRVDGTLGHGQSAGDGVRARIVSSSSGLLGEWTAFNSKTLTNLDRVAVKVGDTIDFLVDCRAADTSDGYTWAPRVTSLSTMQGGGTPPPPWDAKADFAPKQKFAPLTPLETLAQALLVSNEMMFIE